MTQRRGSRAKSSVENKKPKLISRHKKKLAKRVSRSRAWTIGAAPEIAHPRLKGLARLMRLTGIGRQTETVTVTVTVIGIVTATATAIVIVTETGTENVIETETAVGIEIATVIMKVAERGGGVKPEAEVDAANAAGIDIEVGSVIVTVIVIVFAIETEIGTILGPVQDIEMEIETGIGTGTGTGIEIETVIRIKTAVEIMIGIREADVKGARPAEIDADGAEAPEV